jgi:hypothetical protein
MGSAVVVAASVYVRPASYYLPILITVILIAWFMYHHRRDLITAIIIFPAISYGLIAAWQVRNYVETGYAGFSGIQAEDIYFYGAASVIAYEHGTHYYDEQAKMGYHDYTAIHPEQRTWSWPQRFRYMSHTGVSIIMAHPMVYARIHLIGVGRLILDPGAVEMLKLLGLYHGSGLLGVLVDKGWLYVAGSLASHNPVLFWSSLVLFLIEMVYLLGAATSIVVCRQDLVIVTIVLIIIYFVVIAGGPGAYARFRHPVAPLLSVLAGCGLVHIKFRKEGI